MNVRIHYSIPLKNNTSEETEMELTTDLMKNMAIHSEESKTDTETPNSEANEKDSVEKCPLAPLKQFTDHDNYDYFLHAYKRVRAMFQNQNDESLKDILRIPKEAQDLCVDTKSKYHVHHKQYVCADCDRLIPKCQLKSHLKTHRIKSLYMCKICSEAFKDIGDLKNHSVIHNKEKSCICAVCSKAFSCQNNLKAHLQTHTKEKANFCEVCKKEFDSPSQVTKHLRTHLKEKPFSCEVCKKTYRTQQELIVHCRRRHNNQKIFTCEICNSQFISNVRWYKHLQSHSKETIYCCKFCDQVFQTKKYLKIHLRTHSKKMFHCKICRKVFFTRLQLSLHVSSHSSKKSCV